MTVDLVHQGYAAVSRFESWLREHGQFTSGAAIALIAWALASWVHGRSKRWEFRANTLREVSYAYNRLLLAALKINAAHSVARVGHGHTCEGRFTAGVPDDWWMEFHNARNECWAMKPIIELHFRRKDVRTHYQGVLDHVTNIGDPDHSVEARDVDTEMAQLEWNEFLLCAGIEVGVNTWWRRLRRWVRAKWRRFRGQGDEEP